MLRPRLWLSGRMDRQVHRLYETVGTDPGTQLVPNKCLWKRTEKRGGKEEGSRQARWAGGREEITTEQPVWDNASSFS